MKLRAQMVLRVLLAAVLLLAAGAAAYVIKDVLAERRPQSVLPEIRVVHGGEGLPAKHVMMDSYSWSFLRRTINWEEPDRNKRQAMEYAPVLPSEKLDIVFSFASDNMLVLRAEGESQQFEVVRGDLTTPAAPGEYTYRVEADWGSRGTAWFYFKLLVVGPADAARADSAPASLPAGGAA